MTPAELWRRFLRFVRRDRVAAELEEEMRLHLELRTRANEERGMRPDDARWAARRRFGNPGVLAEASGDAWGLERLHSLLQDARYALRQLGRHRTSTIVAVLTLGLGVAATTSMGAFANAMLFTPAHASDPDRLVWVTARQGIATQPRDLSNEEYRALRDRVAAFAGVSAYEGARIRFTDNPAQNTLGRAVSANFFDLLGVRATVGRTFAADEDRDPGAHPVAVLSWALWQSRFGGDRRIVGATVSLNRYPFTVIGVAPKGFGGFMFGDDADLWIPLSMAAVIAPPQRRPANDEAGRLSVIARLAPNATTTQAAAAASVVGKRQQPPGTPADSATRIDVSPVRGGLVPTDRGRVAPLVWMSLVVPALVLLVACANVGNLRLARAIDRRREMAVRRALGASRGRLARQLLTESLVLALGAGFSGVVLSFWLTRLIGALGEVPQYFVTALTPDAVVLSGSIALIVISGIAFGIAPALVATSPALTPSLKDEAITVEVGRRRHPVQGLFVVAQVAVSLLLVILAGLFLRSMQRTLAVDPGFDSDHVVWAFFNLDLYGYTPIQRERFERELLERARAVASVRSAALTSFVPLSNALIEVGVTDAGGTATQPEQSGLARLSPGYFKTMGIGLLKGRDFTVRDRGASAAVAIVNETLASRLWPNASPIGKRIRLGNASDPGREVVGVAPNGRYGSLAEDPRGFVYVPPDGAPPTGPFALVVNASGGLPAVREPLRRIVLDLDPELQLNAGTAKVLVSHSLERQRSVFAMLGVFGAIALGVAALGIYGVIAHGVSARTREIGIRMALGARAAEVLRLFVGEGVRLTLVGVGVGLVAGAALWRVVILLMFGLAPSDALTLVASATVLTGVAAVASYVPARRAARVDPLVALRGE
jgi:predicted permease